MNHNDHLDGMLWWMYGPPPSMKKVIVDIEGPNFIAGLSLEEPNMNMCKCNKLIDFLCENHKKAIEYRYHSNTPIIPESITRIHVIVSKHGAWIEAFRLRSLAEKYAMDKGYRWVRRVTDFDLTKDIWQHPTQDREYAIIQLEVK